METFFTQLFLPGSLIAQPSLAKIEVRLPLRTKNLTNSGIAVPQYHLMLQTQTRRTAKSTNQEHA
jgi:hypothetical protein